MGGDGVGERGTWFRLVWKGLTLQSHLSGQM